MACPEQEKLIRLDGLKASPMADVKNMLTNNKFYLFYH